MVSKEEKGVGVAEVLPADMIAVIQNQCVHQYTKAILLRNTFRFSVKIFLQS